jgi:ribosomal protein S12 methylthiotransferase
VGYPGETQEDFEILKDFVQEMKFDRMGFAYSHEENTHAYLLRR